MFLENLRNQTNSCHAALEKNHYSKILLSPHVSTEDYSTYLQKLYGFVQGFEKIVYPLLMSVDTAIDTRRKSHFLWADLLLLGCDVKNIPLIPDAFFRSNYATTATALGGLYVLEGSVLGGAVIKKHLQQTLGESISDKLGYYTAYGAHTGTVWKNFLRMLTDTTVSTGKEEEIINSAVQTFKILDSWIATNTYNQLQYDHQEPC